MAIIPIYIPTYINSPEYTPAKVQPRLLFYNGMLDCESYYIESGSTGFGGISFEQSAFPYFDNYNVVTGSFPTTGSKSLLFYNEEAVYGQVPNESLYSEYWSEYVSLLYNPRTKLLNASAIIPLADYFKIELNDVVEFRGNYYHLRAINDYNLKNGECSLQLLGPILSDALNLPTDCNYSSMDVVCVLNIQYLVVGGGGASGGDNAGGGGGGGLRSGSIALPTGTYNVIVGAGGITYPQNGKNSSLAFPSASIAIGGGAGCTNEIQGNNGGSGGGGGGLGDIFQGNSGGSNNEFPKRGAGGGGGALTSGSKGNDSGSFDTGGNGGSGSLWINGLRYAGGGGGGTIGTFTSQQSGGLAGPGGGGEGGNTFNNPPGTPGVANTGGGGGGGFTSQPGGSGVAIIAYLGSGSQATGGILSYDGTYTYHTFTSASLAATNGTGSFIY